MKKSRIELIIKLIGENDIENQEELVKLLANNGIHITQATASRDIARLNIVKIKKDGKSCYALYDNSKLIPEDSINLLKGFINNEGEIIYDPFYKETLRDKKNIIKEIKEDTNTNIIKSFQTTNKFLFGYKKKNSRIFYI